MKKQKRYVATVVAMVAVVALLLTGTFTWRSISQMAWNQAVVLPGQAGGRLHDDFEFVGVNYGQNEWRAGGSANKDVYVENFFRSEDCDDFDPDFDEGARDIFVRIRLYEFMELGEGARLHPGETDFDTRDAATVLAGADREDFTTWRHRTPTTNDAITQFWGWDMGGQKYFMPTFNRDVESREADVKGAARDPQAVNAGELVNQTRRDVTPVHANAFPVEAGEANFFEAGDTHTAQMKFWCEDTETHQMTTTTVTHTARQTLNAQVVTMSYWMNELGGEPGEFWVWDADGWFYWAQPLAPGTATGLLLSAITLLQETTEEMYYAIHIDAQMATASEWDEAFAMDSRTPSANAVSLLNRISGGNAAPPPPLAEIIQNLDIGETFVDSNNIEWRVLYIDGDYRLLLTELAFIPTVSYNADNAFTVFSASDLAGHMAAWGEANMADALRGLTLVPNNVDVDVRDHPNQPDGPLGLELGPAGFTSPGASVAAAQAHTALFALSRTEANEYFRVGGPGSGGGFGDSANPNRQAYHSTVAGTHLNWWLRSPGNNDNTSASLVGATGGQASARADASAGLRPALWISVA